MAVQLPDVALSRNAGWEIRLQFFQDVRRTLPLPLAGYTVKSQLRAGESQAARLLAEIATAIVDESAALNDPDCGWIILSLTRAQIAAITAAEGWADVLLIPPAADPLRVCWFHAVVGDGETVWP